MESAEFVTKFYTIDELKELYGKDADLFCYIKSKSVSRRQVPITEAEYIEFAEKEIHTDYCNINIDNDEVEIPLSRWYDIVPDTLKNARTLFGAYTYYSLPLIYVKNIAEVDEDDNVLRVIYPFNECTARFYKSNGFNGKNITVENKNQNKKETTTMKNPASKFNELFDFSADQCRLSFDGSIAVRTGTDEYKTYNPTTKQLTNCEDFVFDVGENMIMMMPVASVSIGDVIKVAHNYHYVTNVNDDGSIETVKYEDGSQCHIVPENHIFLGRQFAYQKVFPIFNVFNQSAGNPNFAANPMLMYMMMQNSGNGDFDFSKLLPFMMMSGQNPFAAMMGQTPTAPAAKKA